MEEEVFAAKTSLNDILEEMKTMEEEMKAIMIENERMNEDFKECRRLIYKANKECPVDMALGRALNTFPEREALRIMFLRESEGVYRFGQKRVYIKVEKGGSIFVRVGGGFMAIDEFIYQFTQLEVDKIERKDVSYKFKSKIMAQRIAANADGGGRETSPVRSPERGRSPMR